MPEMVRTPNQLLKEMREAVNEVRKEPMTPEERKKSFRVFMTMIESNAYRLIDCGQHQDTMAVLVLAALACTTAEIENINDLYPTNIQAELN